MNFGHYVVPLQSVNQTAKSLGMVGLELCKCTPIGRVTEIWAIGKKGFLCSIENNLTKTYFICNVKQKHNNVDDCSMSVPNLLEIGSLNSENEAGFFKNLFKA